jgi:GTP cyclohydrolase I
MNQFTLDDELYMASKIGEVLEVLGLPVGDENFLETPARFIGYLKEYHQPYNLDEVLKIGFSNEQYRGMVVQADIPFRTCCPHHLLPVMGVAHIGYIPGKRVVGLSKFTRLVEAVGCEMPRMQETINDIIADKLCEKLEPVGVMVVIKALHSCMSGRGVAVPNVHTTTSSVRGAFRDNPAAREEFFRLIKV